MTERPISTEEMDALLQAVQSGAVSEGKEARGMVKPYDFARPDKFSKEQLRTLEMIHASAARGLTTQLSTLLRTPVDVELKEISETTYQVLFDAIPPAASIALSTMDPLAGRSVLEIDPEMTFALVDRLLGGPGRVLGEIRDLTEIEKGLLGRVVDRATKCMVEAWNSVITLTPALETILGSTSFSQIATPDDRLVLTVFSVRMGAITRDMRFGVPVSALDPVLSKLSAQHLFAGGREAQGGAFSSAIRQTLDGTDLPLSVEIGRTQVTVRDLLDLQVGDMVRMHRKAGGDLSVLVGDQVKFEGRPGQVGRRLGVRISRVLNGEE